MTKKDFEAIADILLSNSKLIENRTIAEINLINALVECIAYDMSDYMATTNQKFDSDRFMKACGVPFLEVK